MWGSLTLEQARKAAKATAGHVATGRDPAQERKSRREAAKVEADANRLTLAVLLADWKEIGLADRRDSYRKEAVRAISVAFSAHLGRRADALTRKGAIQVLDALVREEESRGGPDPRLWPRLLLMGGEARPDRS